MAKLSPFKALRYDKDKVKDYGKVTAPPYDILKGPDQDFYYGLSPYNVVRIDFGKEQAGDNETTNKYSRAARLLSLWREQGVFKRDGQAAFYVIAHDFKTPEGKKMSFSGVYGALKVEDYKKGVVKPHEKTLSKPKSDRMDLTKATRANLSPIFMLFDDRKGGARKWLAAQQKAKPAADFKVPNGERHRLWIVTKAAAIKALQKGLAKLPVYIADGHHRYETMLKFSKEAKGALKKGAAETMVCLAPFQSEGMCILPTHRVVDGLKEFHPARLIEELGVHFDVKEMPSVAAVEAAMKKAFHKKPYLPTIGMVLASALPCHILSLKKGVHLKKVMLDKRSDAYKSLDVAILQSLILEGCLGMTPESIAAQQHLSFEKNGSKAAQPVLDGKAQAAFLVNPTRMEQLQAVADAKDVMPQKSTYFLPKLLTGMVLREIG